MSYLEVVANDGPNGDWMPCSCSSVCVLFCVYYSVVSMYRFCSFVECKQQTRFIDLDSFRLTMT